MGRDLTLTQLENLVVEMIGEEATSEGIFLTDRKIWVSNINVMRATCPTCGQEFVGPDYNVFHLLATHDYGHAKMLEMAQNAAFMEDDDDDHGGYDYDYNEEMQMVLGNLFMIVLVTMMNHSAQLEILKLKIVSFPL